MFKKYWPIIGLAAVGAYLYFKGFAKTLENLRATLFSIKYDSKRTAESIFTTIYLNVTIKIENPNNQAVKINEIKLNVLRNGRQLADGRMINPYTLAAKAETKLPIQVKFPTLEVFKLIADFLKLVNDKEAFLLKINGFVKADGNTITFSKEQPVQWFS